MYLKILNKLFILKIKIKNKKFIKKKFFFMNKIIN